MHHGFDIPELQLLMLLLPSILAVGYVAVASVCKNYPKVSFTSLCIRPFSANPSKLRKKLIGDLSAGICKVCMCF